MAYEKMKKPKNSNNKVGNKSNSKLKKPKRPSSKGQRPSPKMLGTGMAREAAEAALKRKKMMEDVWKSDI